MEIPWIASDQPFDGPALVMGSRFELNSSGRSPAFLKHSLRIWRQARHSPGLLGISLRAYPADAVYWTLSAWTEEKALREFASQDPHRTIMKLAQPWTKTATFRYWTTDDLDPDKLWAQTELRIGDADRDEIVQACQSHQLLSAHGTR